MPEISQPDMWPGDGHEASVCELLPYNPVGGMILEILCASCESSRQRVTIKKVRIGGEVLYIVGWFTSRANGDMSEGKLRFSSQELAHAFLGEDGQADTTRLIKATDAEGKEYVKCTRTGSYMTIPGSHTLWAAHLFIGDEVNRAVRALMCAPLPV